MKARSPLAHALVHLVLLILGAAFLLPLLWMLGTALKSSSELSQTVQTLWPRHFAWDNFWKAITYQSESVGYIPMLQYARNTLFIACLSVSGTVIVNVVVAYGFACLTWPGRDKLFLLAIATMMIPFPALMIPTYVLFLKLHLVGTLTPMWLTSWFGGAFDIFLLRQFFKGIPVELLEAARIDGASELTILRRLVVPLGRPAIAVVGIFHVLYIWNDFIRPLIYLTDQRNFTLSLGLQYFVSQHNGVEWNLLMAAATLIVLPVLILFFAAQSTFIEGLSQTGLKG